MNLSHTFLNHFEALEDPRLDNHNLRHNLIDYFSHYNFSNHMRCRWSCKTPPLWSLKMPPLTKGGEISMTIDSGADTWTEIYELAVAKEEWLKTFLSLPNGIPSHDTFGRVFSLINPDKFELFL